MSSESPRGHGARRSARAWPTRRCKSIGERGGVEQHEDPAVGERERRGDGIAPSIDVVLARGGAVDEDEGRVLARAGEVSAREERNRVDAAPRDDDRRRLRLRETLEPVVRRARLRRVDADGRGTREAAGVKRVVRGGALQVVLEALGARRRFALGVTRRGLARHAPGELRARVTERRELVGELSERAGLFERHVRDAHPRWKEEDGLDVAAARDERGARELRVAHPARQAAQVGTTNLDVRERFGAYGGLGLAARDDEELGRDVGRLGSRVARGVDAEDRDGVERPELGRRGDRRRRRLAERVKRAGEGALGVAAAQSDLRFANGDEAA